MPRPPASQTQAIIQKFAIATHIHDLPICTAAKHSKSCKRHGIWLGCKRIGRVKYGYDRDGNRMMVDDRRGLCMHLIR